MPYSPEQAMQMKSCATKTCDCLPNQDYQGVGELIGTTSHDLNLIRAKSTVELTDEDAQKQLGQCLDWLTLYPPKISATANVSYHHLEPSGTMTKHRDGNYYLHPSKQADKHGSLLVDRILEERRAIRRRISDDPILQQQMAEAQAQAEALAQAEQS